MACSREGRGGAHPCFLFSFKDCYISSSYKKLQVRGMYTPWFDNVYMGVVDFRHERSNCGEI